MANTGNLIQPRLKYVTDDANEEPLDVNGVKTSISGLPQATAPNPPSSPSYRILDVASCPVDPSSEVDLNVIGSFDDINNEFTFTGVLSATLTEDLTINFDYSFTDDGLTTVGFIQVITIIASSISGSVIVPYTNTGTVTSISPNILTVTPNPNGGKVIIY